MLRRNKTIYKYQILGITTKLNIYTKYMKQFVDKKCYFNNWIRV